MIGNYGVIFLRRKDRVSSKNIEHFGKNSQELLLKTELADKGWDGDSGVGQASESPSRSLSWKNPVVILLSHLSFLRSLNQLISPKLISQSGLVLMILAIGGVLFTYGPWLRAEIGFRLSQKLNVKAQGIDPETDPASPQQNFGEILAQAITDQPQGVPDANFSLIIPKISARGKIIANVDPADSTSYMTALKEGIAHAKGTNLPGGNGNIYLFAHSTDSPINVVRFNAIFYLLRELEVGDEVLIYFHGVKHRYIVNDKKIVAPEDTSYLTPSNPENKERLVLQTCWPPGTTLKRLLIFAEKVEV